MICKKCGQELSEEEKFCSNCGKKATKDKSIIKILLKVLGIIMLLILAFAIGMGIFFGGTRIKQIFNPNKNNMIMELRNNETKKIYINEEEIRSKVNNLMRKISSYYPKAKINQVNEIKLIYNYEADSIEYVYLNVNLDRYYQVGYIRTTRVQASLSKNGIFADGLKTRNNGDNDLIFDIDNLSSNCGLLTQENNEILVQIKNELNNGRNNTFYGEIIVYE